MTELEFRIVEAAIRGDVGAVVGFSTVLAHKLRISGEEEVAKRLVCVLSGESQAQIRPAVVIHGVDCPKRKHIVGRYGYLHGENDDTPYDVDSVQYCGRCHAAL